MCMNEHLALEVASREEDEDHLRAADVALQRADVFEIIDIEKHLDARQKQLQLALDDRDGVLTGGPIERGEGLVRMPHSSHKDLNRRLTYPDDE